MKKLLLQQLLLLSLASFGAPLFASQEPSAPELKGNADKEGAGGEQEQQEQEQQEQEQQEQEAGNKPASSSSSSSSNSPKEEQGNEEPAAGKSEWSNAQIGGTAGLIVGVIVGLGVKKHYNSKRNKLIKNGNDIKSMSVFEILFS